MSIEYYKEEIQAEKNKRPKLTFKMAAHVIYRTIKLQRLIMDKRREKKTIKKSEAFKKLVSEYEVKSLELAPEIDGRIICIS